MTSQRKALGRRGEDLAAEYLLSHDYRIVARNWRCAVGELDVVAQQGDELVFVEVRTRRGTRRGTPEESVTPKKQAKLIELAQSFLAEMESPPEQWRIDVIAIVVGRENRVERLNHIRWAVEG